ncbi:unnamed protein product [Kuraishia capsulata CBS 1993]|uniref:Cyclin N-terminal domain-containing protein n=1 Tax=Kuraishia capsulata CBS 1993 TaxID=1382522 RepID=W6MG05_9ASCO|nr:uncharacterized protein KUCA_T00000582001 [Kuraishia capsulata CBS 1993]CDK24616.1 unnamed protein product [Kuraishia capsulata CBS 1993]
MIYSNKDYFGQNNHQPSLLPSYHAHSKSFQPFSSFVPQHGGHMPSYSYSGMGIEAADRTFGSGQYYQSQPGPQPFVPQHDFFLPQVQMQMPSAQMMPMPSQQLQQPPHAPQQAENTSNVGGVAAVLEYDMDQMTRFVCWLSYGLMKRTDTPSASFNTLVKHVLSAIRLPRSTIILALIYLSHRMEGETEGVTDDGLVFQNLTIALVLSNKFHNDNTFTNKSWSDATGLNVRLINQLEREWLAKIGWKLHHEEGYQCLEDCWKTWCEKFSPRQGTIPSSPSTNSLFSERSQFTPVHTPVSSPWFEETSEFPPQQPVYGGVPMGINPFGVSVYPQSNSMMSSQFPPENNYFGPYYQVPQHTRLANTASVHHQRTQSLHHPAALQQRQPQHQVYGIPNLSHDDMVRIYQSQQHCMSSSTGHEGYHPSYCTASAC